jgi:hypothetical protein
MASFTNLPFTLSADDAALFKSLQASALLPALAKPGEGELVQLYKQNKREQERKIIEPYADLLESELKEMLQRRKEGILKQLRESKSTTFQADLFSWNTVTYSETLPELKRRVSEMTHEEFMEHNSKMADRDALIKDKGWETTFAVQSQDPYAWGGDENEPLYTYYPKKVDRIFRNSDLAFRLSLALGPNFYPNYRWQRIAVTGEHDEEHHIVVYKRTLYVTYYPFGVTKHQMAKLLSVAKRDADRTTNDSKTTYAEGEFGVGHALLQPEEVVAQEVVWGRMGYEDGVHDEEDGAFFVRRSRFSRGDPCFCGCEEVE